MNPNETNPSSPTGTSGAAGGATPASSVPSPVDFTNPSSLNTNTSSLSMADSLASAQDNLTSAGQAADTGASTAMGLGEIGAGSASATLDRPGEALTPADPVPGSIGSVTSVPPLAPEPMDMGALGGSSAANTAATSDPFGATATNNTFGPSTSGADATTASGADTMATAGGAFGATNTAATETATGNTFGATAASATPTASSFGTSAGSTDVNTAAATKPVQPYYNPFARTMGANTAATSSTNVPPALQPQMEKFSNRMNAGAEKKKPNIMMLLGWLLTALFAVTTVVFLILWMDAKNNPQIIYRDEPVTPDEPVSGTVPEDKTTLKCTIDGGAEVEGTEGLVGLNSEIIANYTSGALADITTTQNYTYADVDAASAAKPGFDMMAGLVGSMADAGITSSVSQLDNVISYGMVVPAGALSAEGVTIDDDFPVNENGEVDTSIDALKGAFEGRGAVCTVE